jgi:hypothetical protein
MNPDRLRLVALALLGGIVIAAAVVWFGNVTAAPSAAQRAGNIARRYAARTTLWNSGPTVTGVRIVRLSRLGATLHGAVTTQLADDVNVTDLQRRVGKNRQVAMVILHGTFNTLPPAEGVTVTGNMVAIVDMPTHHVLLLTE